MTPVRRRRPSAGELIGMTNPARCGRTRIDAVRAISVALHLAPHRFETECAPEVRSRARAQAEVLGRVHDATRRPAVMWAKMSSLRDGEASSKHLPCKNWP